MSLRKKTLWISGMTITTLIVILYIVSRIILLDSFQKLEVEYTQENTQRALDALSADLSNLDRVLKDYATWDDTYAFMQGENTQSYIESNLVDQTFNNLGLDLMIFTRCSGEVIYKKAYDQSAGREIVLPENLLDKLAAEGAFQCSPDLLQRMAGIQSLPKGALMVAIRPVLTSNSDGPVQGKLIFGQFLGSDEIQRLAETTHLSISLRPINTGMEFIENRTATKSSDIRILPLSQQTIAGEALIRDLSGQPAYILRVEIPRKIYQQGQSGISYFLFALLVMGLTFGVMSLVSLERLLLSPLARLNWNVQQICGTADHRRRLPVAGRDEIASLSTEINKMLAELEKSGEIIRETDRRNILSAIPDLLFIFNREGRCVDFKAGQENNLSILQQDVLGKQISEFGLSPEAVKAISQAIELSINTRMAQTLEFVINRGLPFDFEARIVALNENEALVLARNITERKKAEALLQTRNEELRQSEAEMRALFSAMNDVVIVYDRTGGYQKIASTSTSLLYQPPDEMIGKRLEQVLPEDKAELLLRHIQLALDTQQTVYLDYSLTIDGREIWFAAAISPMQADRAILVAHDITERKQMERDLQESQERYVLAIQGANDGLWDWDLRKDKIYYSPRWKSMLGYGESEVGDSPEEWFSRIHPEDLLRVKNNLNNHLQGKSHHFESEHRMRHKDGSYRWVLTRGLAVRAVDMASGSITHGPSLSAYRMAGSQSDITDRKRAEDQLLHDAFHDALTGLPNRALFLDRLGRAIERHVRFPENLFAVLFLDLDRFKVINDSLGHAVGDQLLISIANRLKVCLRGSDTVARLGGDEFVILLEDFQDISDAILVAERILGELRLAFNLDGQKIFTTASMGIVMGKEGYERPADVLRDADIALYRAKAQGRDHYELFDDSLRTEAVALQELESELRGAMERREFQLHYQVISSLKNDRIIGFEALLRWHSPTRGNVPPMEFIPLAEQTGLIVPIGEWVLREACQQLRKWQEEYLVNPPLCINVNISSVQFSQPGLVDLVKRVLSETGLEKNSLRLEITESVFMENAEHAMNTLNKLRDLGVNLQIDDFGTGYSSLAYLQRFPISTIKIDRSFISRMSANSDGSMGGAEIVKTIVNLARDLGMESIAEGVETDEQLEVLKGLDCGYGQGYLIARPVDVKSAEALLRSLT